MGNNKNKIFAVIAIGVLLLLLIGSTFAYFAAQGGDASQTDVNVLTHTVDSLVFETGDVLSITADQTSFAQGKGNQTDSTFARATLKANSSTNTATDHYYVYLSIDENTFEYTTTEKTAELILTVNKVEGENKTQVTSINGLNYVTVGSVSGFDITEYDDLITIANNYEITSTGTKIDEWEVILTLVNLDSNQNANAGKIFIGTLLAQKDEYVQTISDVCTGKNMSSCLVSNYTLDTSIYYHIETLINGANDNSYRYSGSYETTNNWICFGTDDSTKNYVEGWCDDEHLYRIIGVFDSVEVDSNGNSTGSTEQRVKLIKAYEGTEISLGTEPNGNASINATYYKGKLTSVPYYYWSGSSSNGSNNWTISTLNIDVLNGTYLTTLGSNWTDKIAITEWKIGGNEPSKIYYQTAAVAYQNEVVKPSTNIVANPKYNAKIGLMYISDYGFAASQDNWKATLTNYGNDINRSNNWLFMGITELSISPIASGSYGVFIRDFDGGVYSGDVNGNLGGYRSGVRPTFYLKSSVTFAGGSGTEADPYRIA